MARTKKVQEEIKEEKKQKVDYGSGWSGINNRIQGELRGEDKKNE